MPSPPVVIQENYVCNRGNGALELSYEMASSCMHNLRTQQSGGNMWGSRSSDVFSMGNPSRPLCRAVDAGVRAFLVVIYLFSAQSFEPRPDSEFSYIAIFL